jgi:hypothetical protein
MRITQTDQGQKEGSTQNPGDEKQRHRQRKHEDANIAAKLVGSAEAGSQNTYDDQIKIEDPRAIIKRLIGGGARVVKLL